MRYNTLLPIVIIFVAIALLALAIQYNAFSIVLHRASYAPAVRMSVDLVEKGFEKVAVVRLWCSRNVTITIIVGGKPVGKAACYPKWSRIAFSMNWRPGSKVVVEAWWHRKRIAEAVALAPPPRPAVDLSNVTALPAIVASSSPSSVYTMVVRAMVCTRDNPVDYVCLAVVPGSAPDYRYISVFVGNQRIVSGFRTMEFLRDLWRWLGLERVSGEMPKVQPSRLIMVDVGCSRAPLSDIVSSYVVYGAVYVFVGPELGKCYYSSGRLVTSPIPMPYTQVFPNVTVFTGSTTVMKLRLGTSVVKWVAPLVKPGAPVLVARVGQGYIVWIPAMNVTRNGAALALYRVILFRYWLHPVTKVEEIRAGYAAWCRTIVLLPLGLRPAKGLYTIYVTVVGDGVASYGIARFAR